jgi:hypothetical protein
VLDSLLERTHYDREQPGYFWLKAPIGGTVLNSDLRDQLNRPVKPSEPIMRLGDKLGDWEVEMKIPQKHISQVKLAFPQDDPNAKLDVDLMLASAPTRIFRGKLSRDKIGGEAIPDRDANNEAEPVVIARVQIDDPDMSAFPAASCEPPELRSTARSAAATGRWATRSSMAFGSGSSRKSSSSSNNPLRFSIVDADWRWTRRSSGMPRSSRISYLKS